MFHHAVLYDVSMVKPRMKGSGMKRTLTYLMTLAILTGFTIEASAKKREPEKRDVEKEMEKLGGEHYVEDMKIRFVGSIEVADDEYYHIFSARLPGDGGYHLIIYDNVPSYVGFYQTEFEPVGIGEYGVEIDNGVIDPATEAPLYATVPLDDTGPPARIQISGQQMPSTFVPAPEPEPEPEPEVTATPSSSSSSSKVARPKKTPKYREWDVTVGDTVVHVESAIFVDLKDGKVTIKDGKTNRQVTRPIADFSETDKAYMRGLYE